MTDPARPATPDLRGVAVAMATDFVSVVAVGWGDRRVTHRVVTDDARHLAVRRFAGPGASGGADRVADAMARMAHAGLPVPPATRVDTVDAAWIVTPWIEGALGASWLDSPERARHIADRMGRLAAGIRRVADRRLGFDRDAAAPEALAGQASAWRADMRDELDDATASVIDAAVRFLGEHPPWDARLAHGDFAPINVIVDATGEIVALLDLEHARVGPPLLDVAWWGWVVRHHHPDAWSAASATFLTAAGVDRGAASERNLHALRLIRLLEAAATADDDASRRRWIGRLTEAATW